MTTITDARAPRRRRSVTTDRPSVDADAVVRVTAALNETLELPRVLRSLADLSVELVGGDRAEVLLVDDRSLVRTAAAGAPRGDVPCAAPRADDAGPFHVGLTARQRAFLRRGEAIAITDASTSDDVPKWVNRSRLRGLVVVPIATGGESFGLVALHWRRPHRATTRDLALLETVGACAASAIQNARRHEAALRRLHANADHAARRHAAAIERHQIADDAQDIAGRLFVALGTLARQVVDDVPRDSPWVAPLDRLIELADEGTREMHEASRAMAFVPATRSGLVSALRALARSIESDGAVAIMIDADGFPAGLAARPTHALYRVAHQAITNAWRRARGAFVRVSVLVDGDECVLQVVDDGVGLGLRHTGIGIHTAVARMRRVMDEVGGTLTIGNAPVRGVVVEARVPMESR